MNNRVVKYLYIHQNWKVIETAMQFLNIVNIKYARQDNNS